MSKEIERKFLVQDDSWRMSVLNQVEITQAYIQHNDLCEIRIRLISGQAFLTIKSSPARLIRDEYEYEIPYNEAEEMITKFCDKEKVLVKDRYFVQNNGNTWIVDEYKSLPESLIVAEVELPTETTLLEIPLWVGKEVTGDKKYYNANLAGSLQLKTYVC